MNVFTEAQAIVELSEMYEGDEVNAILADASTYGMFADDVYYQGAGWHVTVRPAQDGYAITIS